MANYSPTIFFIFVLLMSITKWCACSSHNNSSLAVGCKESERKALLNFKQQVMSSYFKEGLDTQVMSSWEGGDCCKWDRVSCDPTTGDVLKLQLSGIIPMLFDTEELESSLEHLKELKHLEHLDLSCNYFSESNMLKALGSMHQLRYLNLSQTYFGSGIPDELSNLTHLQSLDLNYAGSLTFNHLDWVSRLRELQYLDLSFSDLSQADEWVKSLIGPLPSLRELRLAMCFLPPYNKAIINSSLVSLPIQHLDLSSNKHVGEIPSFIQNLTYLEYLDLSSNYNLGPRVPLWLGKLQSLVHLDLSYNSFSSIDATSIGELVHNLCSLRFLRLSENKLQGNLLEPLENSSTICTHYDLEVLDLSVNNISGAIPMWLGKKFQSLRYLDLHENKLSGEIPKSLSDLSFLEELNLAKNKLSQISPLLNFPLSLNSIDLSINNLMGQIPKSLGNLSKLQLLDMSSNPLLNGTSLSKTHFTNLSNLSHLDLSDTFLTLKLPVDWVSPFQLQSLSVGSCNINGSFPQWLQTQKHLMTLNLSNVGIFGKIPKWFHTMQELEEVDLSYNHISGPPVFPTIFFTISLSHNALSAPLININSSLYINITYPNANSVDLSSNSISGLLPKYLDRQMPNLQLLTLSNNQIYGPIPTSMCKLKSLSLLELQKNRLSGTIPDCFKQLEFVTLSSNKLRGTISCFGLRTRILHLNDNKLSGQLPPCFENNYNLIDLDVGGNELSGKMPAWLTNENVPNLVILRLRGNKLSDSIPQQLCSLSSLQILDLAHNHLSGTIPYCLSNLMKMNSPQLDYRFEFSWAEYVNEVIQGIEREYTTTLQYLTNIDLSCNELMGSIPDGITNLSNLLSLNLSNNHLSGVIPQKIGAMKSLIALDFSKNRLGGTIPTSMAELNGLSYLNLSYNNFSGQFPTGNQLQTLVDPSIYAGNPFLCGKFLPKKCKTINDAPKGSDNKVVEEDEDADAVNKHETMWFYLTVMSGFATGFWGFVGSLLLKRSWRQSLFERVEVAYDWLYVRIVVRIMARLKTKWEGSSN